MKKALPGPRPRPPFWRRTSRPSIKRIRLRGGGHEEGRGQGPGGRQESEEGVEKGGRWKEESMKKRTGVFVCHCGLNIAGTVDVKGDGRGAWQSTPVSTTSVDYVYMCSDPGQKVRREGDRGKEARQRRHLLPVQPQPPRDDFPQRRQDGPASTSFQCEIANIREQCSWVHKDKAKGTEKATKDHQERRGEGPPEREPGADGLSHQPTAPWSIGGGIAGIQSALDHRQQRLRSHTGRARRALDRRPHDPAELRPSPLSTAPSASLPRKWSRSPSTPRSSSWSTAKSQEISAATWGTSRPGSSRNRPTSTPTRCTLCDKCTEVCPVAVPRANSSSA